MKASAVAPILICIAAFRVSAQKQPVEYVNVFTGTSNSRWMLFPGPTLPFGMVKLSPDNQGHVWNGGYEYTVGSISGFSCLHAMGLSGVSLMPVTGSLRPYPDYARLFPGEPDGPFGGMWTAGYRSRIRKETEQGSPGYYAVDLLDYQTKVELTCTMRSGMMRIRFPGGEAAHIVMNNDFPAEELNDIHETYARRSGPGEIEGYTSQSNQYAGAFTVYYVIACSAPFDSMDAWRTDRTRSVRNVYGTDWQYPRTITPNVREVRDSSGSGIVLNFKAATAVATDREIIVKIGISYVSIANARLNLETETNRFGWDFDAVARDARATWARLLGTIEIRDSSEVNKEKFYTCLYRCFTGKSVFNDVNGEYPDMCGRIQRLSAGVDAVYSADGFWGGQWDLAPLWTLMTPRYASSWTKSWMELAGKGGWIPEAPTGLKYAPIMGAQHHDALIISSYQKGIRDFDAQRAFAAIRHDLTTQGVEFPCGGYAGNRQMKAYMDYGYVPDEDGPVSNTLEYAYDDWCAGQFALALGKENEYRYFNDRSRSYVNVFDSVTGLMRRKHRDGSWVVPFDSLAFGTEGGWNGRGYMEGNAWIYSFFVPQDPASLVRLLGRERFNRRLEQGFAARYVDLGNEPSLYIPFLFNYSGEPWMTQKYTRHVLDNFYDASPYTGWVGEEDEGQLSAYFVLLAMGLFEVDGGCAIRPGYDLTSPLFREIIVHLDSTYYRGRTLVIEAENNSAGNVYIQSARFNGKQLPDPTIAHEDIVAGGKLTFTMGPAPGSIWRKPH